MLSTPSPTSTPVLTKTKRKRDSDAPDYPDSEVYPKERASDLTISSSTASEVGHHKRIHLQIDIPSETGLPNSGTGYPTIAAIAESSPSSLFTASDTDVGPFLNEPLSVLTSPRNCHPPTPASLTAPPIPGLFFTPTLRLPQELSEEVLQYCLATYFQPNNVNQVMLFGSSPAPPSPGSSPNLTSPSHTGLPPILQTLLSALSTVLLPILPQHTHALLFPVSPTRARQAILNLYHPGEGISAHVDLLHRFGDGVVGVGFGSGCVMQFGRVGSGEGEDEGEAGGVRERWDVYLPERSVVVLSGDARYGWTHEIKGRREDYVVVEGDGVDQDGGGRWIARGVRLSITFRWLLPGADVVGQDTPDVNEVNSEVAFKDV